MKKFSDSSLTVEEITVDSQRLLSIHVLADSVKDWCLCLQLLYDNLIEACVFRIASSDRVVHIASGQYSHSTMTGQLSEVKILLSARDLDYVRCFFLRYYRDGAAAVDHLDIETENGGYITFKVDESLPPVSPGEAARRLGM